MPLIQNRKTKVESIVTIDDWKMMQEKGIASRFDIIDDQDVQETVLKKPEIFDFMEPEKRDKKDITVSELRDYFDDRGIDYPRDGKKDELYQLYIDG